jgi:hypothetical protein
MDSLLLFDEQHPCWTPLMFSLTGQDETTADALLNEGLLRCDAGVFSLTPEGVEQFRLLTEESFLPLRPGVPAPGTDRGREAARSLLQMLLDKRHLQRWGLKEYSKPFLFEVPDLKDEELFTIDGDGVTWRYPENAVFIKMAEDFPHTGMAARRYPAPDVARIAGWMSSFMPKKRTVTVDLLYKSRYDFQAYAHCPKLPADPCDMLNTDRFFCFFAPPPTPKNEKAILRTLGEFQMYMTMLRHMFMPGYIERDSLDQDAVNWLICTYEYEQDAVGCMELLSPKGRSLGGPAVPTEIWSLSLQALRAYEKTGETIHDLLPDVAHPVLRLS